MMRKIIFILLAMNLAGQSLTWATDIDLKKAQDRYQKGDYQASISILEKFTSLNDPKVFYWKGQNEFKVQNYDAAVTSLKKAVDLGASKEFHDVHYLLGQSSYAVQNYTEAKTAFERSADANYKKANSLYYVGYIQSLIGEKEAALKTFATIQKLKNEKEMKQAAFFQSGEIYYEKAEKLETGNKKESQKIYRYNAMPAYEKAVAVDDETSMAKQANGRLHEVRSKLSIDAEKTAAGYPKALKPWAVRFSQDIKYDSNIINEADGKIVKVSYAGSFLEKTGAFAKYEFWPSKVVIITPEVDASATFHSRRYVGSVFSNDSTSINPALRTRFDHMAFGKAASGTADIETSITTRDYLQRHQQLYYSRYINYVVGEGLELFKSKLLAMTTFKANYKFFEQSSLLQNYRAFGLSMNQMWTPYKQHMLNTGFAYEGQVAKDVFYDQRSYKVNADYLYPQLLWECDFDLALNMTFTDTMNQFNVRGNEITTSPSLTVTKRFNDSWSVTGNYAFTRNSSRDNENYTYSKHVFGVGASLTF